MAGAPGYTNVPGGWIQQLADGVGAVPSISVVGLRKPPAFSMVSLFQRTMDYEYR